MKERSNVLLGVQPMDEEAESRRCDTEGHRLRSAFDEITVEGAIEEG